MEVTETNIRRDSGRRKDVGNTVYCKASSQDRPAADLNTSGNPLVSHFIAFGTEERL